MLIKILIVFLIIAVIAAVIIIEKHRRESVEKMYRAAGNILKNEFLDYSLHNPMLKKNKLKEPNVRKPTVYLKAIGSKPAKEYVFDPETVIKIGRNKDINSVVLNEAIVSIEHCRIFLSESSVYLFDCGSSNGTQIRRGFNSNIITAGQQILLESGDVIKVGSTEFKVKIFFYDMV